MIVGVPGPEVFASDTVFPLTGLPFESFKVTVTVDVVTPSATTDAGLAATVDVPAATALAVTLNELLVAPVNPLALAVRV